MSLSSSAILSEKIWILSSSGTFFVEISVQGFATVSLEVNDFFSAETSKVTLKTDSLGAISSVVNDSFPVISFEVISKAH